MNRLNNTIVMIVDDDEDDRFFFQRAVKQIDPRWECMEARHGADALKQLRKMDHLPDFIFLDLNMPVMDGNVCLAELKKEERLKNIPVIIYSTSAYQKDIDTTKSLGAAHYMIKITEIFSLPQEIIKAIKSAQEVISANRSAI